MFNVTCRNLKDHARDKVIGQLELDRILTPSVAGLRCDPGVVHFLWSSSILHVQLDYCQKR